MFFPQPMQLGGREGGDGKLVSYSLMGGWIVW